MAIEEVVSVSVTGAGELDALAAAADKAAQAFAKLDELASKGLSAGSAGAGADKLAASYEAAFGKIQAGIDKLDESMAKIGAGAGGDAAAGGLAKIEDGMKAVADQADVMAASVAKADDALKGAGGTADTAAAATARYADAAKAAADTSAGLGDASAAGAAGLDAQAASAAASRDVLTETAAAGDAAAVSAGRVGKSSAAAAESGAGWGTLKTVLLGVGVAAAYGIDKAMKYQSQMLLLHTQAGVSAKDTATMSQGVLKISTETGQSLNDVAESAYHVASNMESMKGSSPAQMLNAVKIAAEGAAVGHSNLVDTTTALTSVIASGIPGAKNYSQAMGALNATVGVGEMNMQQLSEAMGTGVVPVVKGYGLTLKDVGAALATYGDLNIRGAKAGTELRMAVQALAVPAAAAAPELAKLGLSTTSLSKDMQSGGLLKALDDLQGKFKANGITAKNEGAVITDLFGKKAGAGLALLMENMDRVQSKYPALTKGANDFSKAWEATQQSPAQKWKELTAGLQAGAVSFGTELLPAFSKAVGFADKILTDLNGSKGAWKDIAVGAGGLAALFTGKKLVSGIESAFQTGETALRGIGKLFNIPGLSTIGKTSGATGAAATDTAAEGLSGAASALDGAAASLEGAAASLKGEGLPGAIPGEKGGVPVSEGEKVAADAEKTAPAAVTLPGLLAGLQKVILPAAIMTAVDQMFKDEAAKVAPKIHAPQAKPDSQNSSVAYQVAQNTMTQLPVLGPTISALEGLFGVKPGKPWQTPQSTPLPPVMVGRGDVQTRTPAPGSAYTQTFAPGPSGIDQIGAGTDPSPVKLPPPDTSAMTAGVQSAVDKLHGVLDQGLKPVKIPAPDMSAMDAAKGKVTSDVSGITQVLAQAMGKPVKMPPPDLSALTAAKGAAAADGAAVGAGFAAGIAGEAGAAAAAAAGVAAAATAAFKAGLKISSPSKVTEAIGQQTGAGLAKGITDSKSTVDAAAASIGSSSVASLIQGLEGGQSNQQAVQTALYGALANPDAVTTVQQTIQQLTQDIPAGKDSSLVKWLNTQQSKLTALANKQGALMAQINDAQQIATSAISGAGITSAYGYTPALAASSGPQASQSVVTGMQQQMQDTQNFATQLASLKKMGLNATSLSQLAQAGTAAGLPLAEGLAQGGKGAVSQINAIEKQIITASQKIGSVGGTAMYNAAQQVGQGLDQGLKDELKDVDKDMSKIANSIIKTVEKDLGTKVSSSSSGSSTAAGAGTAATATTSTAATAAGASLGKAGSAASGAASGLSAVASAAGGAASGLGAVASAAAGAASALGKIGSGGGSGSGSGGGGGGSGSGGGGGGGGGHSDVPLYTPGNFPYQHLSQQQPQVNVTHVHNYNIQGSLVHQNDLADVMQQVVLMKGAQNWQQGMVLPGRGL